MSEKLNIKQCQERLGLSRSSTYKVIAKEPGVHRIYTPGSKRPIIRVDSTVIDRILLRSTITA